jgi:hypothetical protein
MNYDYQFPGVDNNCTPPGDGVLDYSRGTHVPLDENAIFEPAGICGNVPWDFDFDGAIDGVSYARDVNYDFSQVVLADYDDWAGLRFGFAATGSFKRSQQLVADCDNPAP